MEWNLRAALTFYKFLCFCLFVVIIIFYKASQIVNDPEPKPSRLQKTPFNFSKERTQKFFLKTSKCHIPYVDPFNEEVMKSYRPQTFIPCSNESDLVSAHYDDHQRRYILYINEPIAQQLLNFSGEAYNCFYQEIKHGKSADTYDELEARKYFSQRYVIPQHVEGLLLECQTAKEPPISLQRDAYIFVQHQELPRKLSAEKGLPRKPSVIMYGIDSMSRINVRRTMPLVYEYLKGDGWYEMQGYNKVADNSFPNLFAILSGYSHETAKEQVCDTNQKGCFDEMPLIWKYFRNASYLTAFAEDESGSNTFSYLKPGFTQKPVDYYFRPFLRALEDEAAAIYVNDQRMRYCMGRRVSNSYIYDYCRQFMQRFVAERPIWGMFWTNHYSHDDVFMPSSMQLKVLNDLHSYETDGAFEHTIMIFFADHGDRYGKLARLSEGFLEERLPMMFIYLPPWFRQEYPSYAQALEYNQHRLSSNFDLHNTLKHIIEIGGTPDGPALPRSFDCPTCQSLFYPIAEDRVCSQAGISEHWCTCEPYKVITHLDWADRIAKRVIERMNEYFVLKGLSRLCSNLSLYYIHKTEIKMGVDQTFQDQLPEMEVAVYRTKFKVWQNSADFQATVVFNNLTESLDLDVEKISRTNSYKEDSTCLDDKIAKLYCICLSDLKS